MEKSDVKEELNVYMMVETFYSFNNGIETLVWGIFSSYEKANKAMIETFDTTNFTKDDLRAEDEFTWSNVIDGELTIQLKIKKVAVDTMLINGQ